MRGKERDRPKGGLKEEGERDGGKGEGETEIDRYGDEVKGKRKERNGRGRYR